MINRSRLSRKIDQQSRKNLFFSLLGIIVVIFILIKFGIPLLVNFSLFISGSKNTENENISNVKDFVPVPILNSMPSATSSAEVIISGFASPKQIIELYINENLIDKKLADDKGIFSFEERINSGENIIKAKAIIKNNESEFSSPISIVLRNNPPMLQIDSPIDNQSFSKDQTIIDIKGTTDPDVKVTVNGFRAITDATGHFLYRLSLSSGENKLKIIAEDQAGNRTEKELTVTFSQ